MEDSSSTPTAVREVKLVIPTYGEFIGWGRNTTIEMYAVGGSTNSTLNSNA